MRPGRRTLTLPLPDKNAWVVLIFLFFIRAIIGAAEPRYEAEIGRFEAADATNPPPKNAILFVGSSTIRLWTNLPSAFPSHQVINRGFGGCYMSEVVGYASRIVIPYNPRVILVYAGDNDIANGKQPEEVARDFDSFVELVRSALPRARIGYLAIKPSPVRTRFLEDIRKTNQLIRKRTKAGRNLFYVDVFSPILKRKGEPDPRFFEADGLHLNAKGHEVWAQRIKPFLVDRFKD